MCRLHGSAQTSDHVKPVESREDPMLLRAPLAIDVSQETFQGILDILSLSYRSSADDIMIYSMGVLQYHLRRLARSGLTLQDCLISSELAHDLGLQLMEIVRDKSVDPASTP